MSRSIRVARPAAAAPARQPLAIERVVTALATLVLAASMLVPLSVFGATRNWSLTRSPASVTGGAPAAVQVTAANIGDDGGGEAVGCVVVAIPASAFSVTGVAIDSVSDGDAWSASLTGDGTWWYVTLYSNSGGGNRLHGVPSESVTATVTFNDTGVDGTFNWTGNAFNKEDCTDDFLQPRSVSVTIDGAAVETAPTAAADAFSTTRNVPLTVPPPGVLANDGDPDGDALGAALISGPSNGAITWSGDGSFSYTPAAGFVGSDAFTYRADDGTLQSGDTAVTIDVTNGVPVATDDAYATGWSQLLTVPAPGFLSNDSDPDGDPLTASIVSSTSNGVLLANPSGSFSYLPGLLFVGVDTFVYEVTDGVGTAQATVRITVGNSPPVAIADGPLAATEDTLLSIAAPGVLANDNDPDGDPLTAVLVAGTTHGSVTLAADGSFDYVPDPDYFGPDSFTYQASDGPASSSVATVSITLAPANDPPTSAPDAHSLGEDGSLVLPAPGVLANDSDPDGDALVATAASATAHGTLTLAPDGALMYVPDTDWHGVDTFTYAASDGTSSATTTVTLSVAAVNDAPVASTDVASTAHATSILLDVLANDTDVDGDPLVIASVSVPSAGSATIVGNQIQFTPPAAHAGPATLNYTASDGSMTDSATVTINVATAPPAPSAPPAPPTPPASVPSASPMASPTARSSSSASATAEPVPVLPQPSAPASETPLPSASPSAVPASPTPRPSPPPGDPPSRGGELAPLAQPELTADGLAGGASMFDGIFSSFGSTFGWAVPAALLGVPGLLFILAVLGQLLGAAAWVPAIRRQLAGIGVRRRDQPQGEIHGRYP